MKINKTELARDYDLNHNTVTKYVKKTVKDESNVTDSEYEKVIELCKRAKNVKTQQEIRANAFKGLQSDARIEFSDEKSSLSELLAQERRDYNYFLKCLDIDKQKVNAILNSTDEPKEVAMLVQIYKKELREDKKSLLSIGARIAEIEEKLSLTDEEENPFTS